ncbi:hypothetical protein PENTCL1PPCAC_20741, partial [Pristionchus entomophagus]
SSLPDDCLMQVFTLLDLKDLDEMSCVNHRMHQLSKIQTKTANNKRDAFNWKTPSNRTPVRSATSHVES